jgi:8-oxo-dGTP pyrophosphatase MutT (NUDIX family)
MAIMNGPWAVKGKTLKHRNEFMEVYEDEVIRPDGKPGTYSTVNIKPGVSVIAVDEAGDTYLTRQFRYALGAESVEVICGSIEEGESALDAARREALEEAGIIAKEWVELGYVDLDTSMVSCRSTLFLARGLTLTEASPEAVETLTTVKMPLRDAVRMVMDCRITHAPSCALILKALTMLGGAAGESSSRD